MKASTVYVAVLQFCADRAEVARYQQDWIGRFADRIRTMAGVDAEWAKQCAEAAAEMNNEFTDTDWDDPVDAADEEMSYWGD